MAKLTSSAQPESGAAAEMEELQPIMQKPATSMRNMILIGAGALLTFTILIIIIFRKKKTPIIEEQISEQGPQPANPADAAIKEEMNSEQAQK
jgi:hypothetical protein